MADVATKTQKTTKPRLVDNFYVNKAGERASRPQPDVVAIGKKFLESGHEIVIKLASLKQEQLLQSAAFGMQQVGQNAYGAAGSEDERIEMCSDRWDTIQGGSWASERQMGPRTSDVLDAYLQALEEKTGKPATSEFVADLQQKLADNPSALKELSENKVVKAKVDAIRAKRAAQRAEASATEAEEADDLPVF